MKIKKHSLSYYSLIAEKSTDEFMPFPKALVQREKLVAFSRIWTWFVESISFMSPTPPDYKSLVPLNTVNISYLFFLKLLLSIFKITVLWNIYSFRKLSRNLKKYLLLLIFQLLK